MATRTDAEADGASPAPTLLLAGHFAGRNVGDDLMLLGFLEGWGDRPARFLITTADGTTPPFATRWDARGVAARPRAMLGALRACDLVVLVGGTHFQDDFKPGRMVRHLRYLGQISALCWTARRMGKHVALVGQGIGPVRHRATRSLLRVAVRAAELVSVRDPASRAAISRYGIEASLAPDLAFLAIRPRSEAASGKPPPGARVGISPTNAAHFGTNPANAAEIGVLLAESLSGLGRELEAVTLFGFQVEGTESDLAVLEQIERAFERTGLSTRVSAYGGDPQAFTEEFSGCDAHVCMRFHSAIASRALGIPAVTIALHEKLTGAEAVQTLSPQALRDGRLEAALRAAIANGRNAPDPALRSGALAHVEAVHELAIR